MQRGVWYGLAAYLAWGLLPIYWKALGQVPALEILANRIVWSLVLVLLILAVRRSWNWLLAARTRDVFLTYLAAAVLLAVNWFVYIWAVNDGHVVETSLGYFINPLVNVVLGVLLFREVLRPLQWVAVAIAASGVLYLTLSYGSLPWIALTLAFSFGFYGVMKKRARLPALEGLALETGILSAAAAVYLVWLAANGMGALTTSSPTTVMLLVGAGVVTLFPLLGFAAAAQRVPLTVLGFMQYLAPTMQFLLGVLLYHEPFPVSRLIGFALIWLALAVFSMDGVMTRRRRLRARYVSA